MISQYIDGFVLSIPKDKIDAYKAIAIEASAIWKEHGALEYRECIGDDLDVEHMVPFPVMAGTKPDETVIFTYVVFPSREVRDEVNAKIMADPRMEVICESAGGIFDYKRMAFGGFQTLVYA
jgi:uncharacterized protein YbaA (DUF1428 family)